MQLALFCLDFFKKTTLKHTKSLEQVLVAFTNNNKHKRCTIQIHRMETNQTTDSNI